MLAAAARHRHRSVLQHGQRSRRAVGRRMARRSVGRHVHPRRSRIGCFGPGRQHRPRRRHPRQLLRAAGDGGVSRRGAQRSAAQAARRSIRPQQLARSASDPRRCGRQSRRRPVAGRGAGPAERARAIASRPHRTVAAEPEAHSRITVHQRRSDVRRAAAAGRALPRDPAHRHRNGHRPAARSRDDATRSISACIRSSRAAIASSSIASSRRASSGRRRGQKR